MKGLAAFIKRVARATKLVVTHNKIPKIRIEDIAEVKRQNEGDIIKVAFYGEAPLFITDQAAKRLVSNLQEQIYYDS